MTISRIALLTALFSLNVGIASSSAPVPDKTVYNYSLVGIDGKETSLATYKGKVLLIVNLASQSIYKNQISALEELQKTYSDKGLVVLGIPSGDFGAEELTDNSAIHRYYADTEHINFPLFAKAALHGKDAIPLVHFLTDPKNGVLGGDIHWNFTKFIVDREGHPVIRFEVDNDPLNPEFRVKIEDVLNGTYKKQDPTAKEEHPSTDDDDDEE